MIFRRGRTNDNVVGTNPFTERGFIVSAVLIGVVLLSGIIVVLSGSDKASSSDVAAPAEALPVLPALAECPGQTGERPAATPSASASAASPGTARPEGSTSPSGAPVPTASAENAAPDDAATNPADVGNVMWSRFNGVAVPFSETAGPLAANGDVARCYAHTPTGATIAAVQISVRYRFSPDWRNIMQHQMQPEPSRDAAIEIRERTAAAVGKATTEIVEERLRQVVGYQIVSYSEEAAMISIVSADSSGKALVSSLYSMVWLDGDWKLRVQATSAAAVTSTRVDSLLGYIAWGESAVRP
ncbi:hypothetical protein [Yinghuangia sp. YIM S10712]|uniref:hypothetical protein n=1 Tax=Yinghuangia sp. YIM S10712 TaxID=3436930 RepID=UPI003F530028